MLREISSPFPSLRTTLYAPDSLKCREMKKNMCVKNLRDHFPGSLRQSKWLQSLSTHKVCSSLSHDHHPPLKPQLQTRGTPYWLIPVPSSLEHRGCVQRLFNRWIRETLLLKGGVWGQEAKAQMEVEEGSLGRTLKRKVPGMRTACLLKDHFYTRYIHHHKLHFPQANIHAGLQLANLQARDSSQAFLGLESCLQRNKGLWDCRQHVRCPDARTRPGWSAPSDTEGRSLSPLWSKAVWARESEVSRNQPLLSGHLLGLLSPLSPTPRPSQEVGPGSPRRAPLVLWRPLAAVRSNAISQPFLLPLQFSGMHSPWALASLLLFLFSKCDEVPYRG